MARPKSLPDKTTQRVALTLFMSYLISLLLPVGLEHAAFKQGYEFFILGGVLQLGLHMLPANIFFLLGLQAMLEGHRTIGLVCGILAIVIGIWGALPIAEQTSMYQFPAFWSWLGSFGLLALWSFSQIAADRSKRNRRRRRH
ncbi:hypothetical protein GC170_07010 [bacterium]|nr:hypothetical protein [bacterium]